MKRLLIVLSVALLYLAAFGQVAFAGEWNKNKGDLPAKYNAQSECAKNGLDQPDYHPDSNPEGEMPEDFFADDELWALSPAGGRVQSGGQIMIIVRENPEEWGWLGVFPGVQGIACNPTTPSQDG